MKFELNNKEIKAIAVLRRLEKIWPKSLWLFSASGSLHVMKADAENEQVHTKGETGGVDPFCSITTINIPNDGGNW